MAQENTRVRDFVTKLLPKKGTNMKTHLILRWTASLVLMGLVGVSSPAIAGDNVSPKWQPMLAKSFKGDVKDLNVNSLIVYRMPGCVFLNIDDKVYCSSAGAGKFKVVNETWQEVCDHADKASSSKHLFVLTQTCIKESKDGGKTWLAPIALPKGFVKNAQSWVQYDAANDIVYLMQKGGDLYKLVRR
jgi:hypothetical protein